jgi:hypothetical protein
MAIKAFSEVVEELQESNLIGGEVLASAELATPIMTDGFLLVAELIADLIDLQVKRDARDDAGDMQRAEDERESKSDGAIPEPASSGGGGSSDNRGMFSGLGDTLKMFAIGSPLGLALLKIQSIWKGITSGLGKIKNVFVSIGNMFKKGGALRSITGMKDAAKGFLGGISRFVLPITAAFSAIAGLWEFFKLKDSLGVFEAFKAGFTTFMTGIVGWLVDLPIFLLEKISGVLGLDTLEKVFADALSFKEMFTGLLNILGTLGEYLGVAIYYLISPKQFGLLIMDGLGKAFESMKSAISSIEWGSMFTKVIDWFTFIPNKIGDMLEAGLDAIGLGGVADKIKEFQKALLRTILPDPNGSKLNPLTWVAKAIPDGIYEYAGMDPSTGKKAIEEPKSESSSDRITYTESGRPMSKAMLYRRKQDRLRAEHAVPNPVVEQASIGKNGRASSSNVAQGYSDDTANMNAANANAATIVAPSTNVNDNSSTSSSTTIINSAFPDQRTVTDF